MLGIFTKTLVFATMLLGLFISQGFSQAEYPCDDIAEGELYIQREGGTCSDPPYYDSSELPAPTKLRVLKVQINRVRRDNGTGNLSDENINFYFFHLRQFFLPYNIDFVLTGINTINNTTLFDIDQSGEMGTLYSLMQNDDVMNIYIVNTLQSWRGRDVFGLATLYGNDAYLSIGGFTGKSLYHEIGHNLGLPHTFLEIGEPASCRENINQGSPCIANARYSGDKIIDTPADYNKIDEPSIPPDACGYTNYNPDKNNVMSYWDDSDAPGPSHFSEQQGRVMHWFIEIYHAKYLANTTPIAFHFETRNSGGLLQDNTYVLRNSKYFTTSSTLISRSFLVDSTEYFAYAFGTQASGEKHHNWNQVPTEYKKVEDFDSKADDTVRITWRKPYQTGVFNASFADNVNQSGVGVTFKDPWEEDFFTFVTTQRPVFLNQIPDPEIPNKPIYAIKSDQPKTVDANLKLYFLNWATTGTSTINSTSPDSQIVVFTGSNPSVTANYKAILGSNVSNWVSTNQWISNTGASSVMYKSNGKVWLHRENGTDWKEIKVSDNGGSITSYSVTPNGNDRYWVTVDGTTTATWGSEVSGSVYGGTLPLAAVPSAGIDLVRLSSTKLAVIYKDGSTIRYHIGTISGTTVNWAGSLSLSGMSDPIQVSTNNSTAYITWLHGSTILSYKLTAGGASTMKAVCYSSSGSFSNLASMCTPGGSLELLARRTNTSTSRKELIETAWYTNNTTKPLTVLAIADTYGDYQPLSYVSEGTKKLGVVKSTTYVPYYSNSLWRHTGTEWLTTLSYPSTDQKLMQGEVDNYPAEITHSSGLKLLQPTAVSWPAPGTEKITAGTDGYTPTLSVAFMDPADTIAWYIDLNPESVDSIRVKPSGQWIIYTNWLENRDEILNDLKQTGRATWVDSTQTIVFVPDTLRYDFWVVDPSGNKVRAGKLSGATERKTLEFEDEVSVHPNPFNPETSIRVHLAGSNQLKIRIFNVLGQLVATLADGSFDIGEYQFRFNGNSLSSGTYFYRIEIGETVKTGKLQLLK